MSRTLKRHALDLPSLLLLAFSAPALSGCNTEAVCFSDCTSQGPIGTGGNDGEGGDDGINLGFGGDGVGIGGNDTGGVGPLEDAGTNCDLVDTQNDPKHCGMCDRPCAIAGAIPKCVAGKCEIASCAFGRIDLDGNVNNGCEYACVPSDPAVEICNNKDDDCDTQVDEDFDLNSDENNCGVCGHACSLTNASSECQVVGADPTCVVTGCQDGWWDANDTNSDGCEYQCEITNGGVEICDALDNDCDGEINNDNPEGGQACDDYCPDEDCRGQCTSGVTTCVGVDLVCIPGESPSIELCDGLNNDCDNATDEDFNFASDPNNCNGCGNSCDIFPNALGKCENSICKVDVCDTDYGELNAALPGCELCPVRPVRSESCNGRDDDCDGAVDELAEVNLTKPATGASAGVLSFCKQRAGTGCNNVPLTCQGTAGWVCQYPASVESAAGKVLVTEARCDGVDGNCDGQTDEAFLELGTLCDDAALGVCLDHGEIKCDPMDVTQTYCDTSELPDPPNGAPFASETCNSKDDNCDGQTDENTDDMVHINRGGLNYWIDKYEASRPDATNTTVGTDETHLCGVGNRLPWTNASFQEARDACLASGKRLCTITELQQACDGVELNRTYPYAGAYVGATCNGIDAPGSAPVATGSRAGCVSADGIFDLSGNVSEWSSTKVGETNTVPRLDIMALHGGSYLTPSNGLTCSFDLDVISTNAVLSSLGFRCCRNP